MLRSSAVEEELMHTHTHTQHTYMYISAATCVYHLRVYFSRRGGYMYMSAVEEELIHTHTHTHTREHIL